jgi:hypothetical protein
VFYDLSSQSIVVAYLLSQLDAGQMARLTEINGVLFAVLKRRVLQK